MLIAVAQSVSSQRSTTDSGKSGSPDQCHTVAVIGAVRTPRRFDLQRNVRLGELIACAGGLADRTGKAVTIVHAGCQRSTDVSREWSASGILEMFPTADVVRGEERFNPYVHGGDVIVVPESDPIYLTGGVVAPQAIQLTGATLTLTQAIAMAGGVVHGTKTDRIRIIRQTVGSSTRTEIIIDLKAIQKHRAEDPVLQPYDIVEVPERRWGDTIGIGPVLLLNQLPLRTTCYEFRF